MRNGVRMALAEINFKGGLLGRPVELVERDDTGNPDKGRAIAEELLGKEKVVATIGSCNTGVVLKTMDLYQKAKVPLMVPVATGVAITRTYGKEPEHYVFRTSADDEIQAYLIAQEAVERRKFTRVALFHDSTPYGSQGRDFLLAALDKMGIKPVAVESFPLGTKDMTEALERARKAGAAAILTYTLGTELAHIANGRARLNWKAPIIGSWPLSWDNFLDGAKGNGDGARMPQTFIEEPTTSRRTEFIVTYLSTHNVKRIPSAVSAAQGYDAMLILAAAIRQAGATEGAKIRAALENLDAWVPGVIATHEKPFTKDDHEAISASLVVMGEVRKGAITYAYREDEKKAIIGRKRRK
jgi:branched-chain amino acid transport system substrate-binding protein